MDRLQIAILSYVILSLALVIILAIMLYRRRNCREGFRKCVCSSREGGRMEQCQDGDIVQQAYDDNLLTENTNLVSPGWSTVSPGDVNFPLSEGCKWPDRVDSRQWVKWDFTDFGSA